MLFGPPGVGKTFLIKAISNEIENLMLINASDIISKYVGDRERNFKSLFTIANEKKPCVLVLDECDAMLSEN